MTILEFCKLARITKAQALGEHIAGYLDLRSLTTPYYRKPFNNLWCGGKYIHADGILSEVVSHRGNVYKVKRIGREKESYLITNGEGAWSHGATLSEARADLLYKLSDRDTTKYKGMTRDTKLSFAEAVAMYRSITGACAEGCRQFVEQRGLSTRKKYSVGEVLTITSGAYRHDVIVSFFSK